MGIRKSLVHFTLFVSLASSLHAGNFLDYIGLGIALEDATDSPNFDTGTALVLTTGKNIYENISLEAEATTSIDKMDGKFNGIRDDLNFWSFGFYSTYLWKLGNLSIKPRVGLIYRSLKSEIDIHSPKYPENDTVYQNTDITKLGLSGGFGLHYELGKHYNIYTNYTKYEDELELISFGAEYKF